MSSANMSFTDGFPGSVVPKQRLLFRLLGQRLLVR